MTIWFVAMGNPPFKLMFLVIKLHFEGISRHCRALSHHFIRDFNHFLRRKNVAETLGASGGASVFAARHGVQDVDQQRRLGQGHEDAAQGGLALQQPWVTIGEWTVVQP